MAKKIVSIIYLLIALYGAYVLVNAVFLMNEVDVNIVNMVLFLLFFTVSFVLLTLLYDLVLQDQFVRIVLMAVAIVNLNYFIMGFFFRLVPTSTDPWAGPVNTLHMLFTKIDFSEATLIEYNLYFETPFWVNIIGMTLISGLLLFGLKKKND